jgi:2-dehydropantoate 2-reductase
MREHGLRVAMPDRVIEARVDVVDDVRRLDLHADDVLVLATKSQDTVAILDGIVALDGPGAATTSLPVVCMQNGVANERMALRRFARVYGCVVMLPAVLLDPGRIDAQGTPYSGLLDLGVAPDGCDATAEHIAADLSGCGFVSRAVPDIMRWKYAKLLRNLGNSIEALCGHDLDDTDLKTVLDLDERMRDEATRAFRAAGIDWTSDEEWKERRQRSVEHAPVEGRGRVGGSSWQSLARGSGSIEADHLNGEIVLLGRLHAVATPVNGLLQREANRAARSGAPVGALRVSALMDALAADEGTTS